MSQARQGANNIMYGKTHTEQSKLLMSIARKGKTHDSFGATITNHQALKRPKGACVRGTKAGEWRRRGRGAVLRPDFVERIAKASKGGSERGS